MMRSKHFRRILFFAVAASIAALAQQQLQFSRKFKPGFSFFGRDSEIQMGKEAAQQMEQQGLPVLKDPALAAYIDRLGRSLTANGVAGDYPYTFKVVNDPEINAFALPGGPIYINTGIVMNADNEAQVVGVMAHEIGHIALRHSMNQMSKQYGIQLAAMAAGITAQTKGGMWPMLAELGIGLGAGSVLMKFSRDHERQADLFGANLMSIAGYNPVEMARFFEKLDAGGGRGGSDFWSSHPNPGNRVQNIEQEIPKLPRRDFNAATGQFDPMKRAAAAVVPAKKFKPGQRPATQQPNPEAGKLSSSGTAFRNQYYALSVPQNWKTLGGGDSPNAIFAPQEALQRTRSGGVNVLYGAVANVFVSDAVSGDLARDTEQLLRAMVQSNPGLRVNRNEVQQTRVGGQAGLLVRLRGDSSYDGGEAVNLLLTSERPDGLFYLVLICPASLWAEHKPLFEQVAASVRFPQ